ncbi:methyltransferase family protein [Roseiarcus fermentans]|uniref:Methyltransferase family protein n=1 Tax=Roseiarcus fermentans TaxID=1473586 RepID=A0A366EN26_9HYPH|nr:rhodoquinone biosynthesis methyltransferase RquA [Roseiarcus fermentans]RBP02889.1 methyltransferase family protein [Roseiarcus fermentans]
MNIRVTTTADAASGAAVSRGAVAEVPAYLEKVYWWTYVRPWAIRLFERQWLINAIVFGNYARLRDKALDLLGPARLSGRTLQIACAYGDLTNRLAARVQEGEGHLDVIDVVPAQIENMHGKLPPGAPVRGLVMDSADLDLPDGRYDRAVLFLLLHEQPDDWRRKTLAEAWRVVRPGGRIVIVDYARPKWWSPFRYIMPPALALLEPFALDIWRDEIQTFLHPAATVRSLRRESVFAGLYQAVVIER